MTKVLDLTAALERDTVKLPDGTTVTLRNREEFGILDEFKIQELVKRADELQARAKGNDLTAEDAELASKTLRDLATMLIVDLQDVEVPDWACVAIFEFWAADDEPKKAGKAVPPRSRRTTAASSRGSKRSTAAPRKTGSRSRAGR